MKEKEICEKCGGLKDGCDTCNSPWDSGCNVHGCPGQCRCKDEKDIKEFTGV